MHHHAVASTSNLNRLLFLHSLRSLSTSIRKQSALDKVRHQTSFLTADNDPTKLKADQLGHFYDLGRTLGESLIMLERNKPQVPNILMTDLATFDAWWLMCRKPLLHCAHYLNQCENDRPAFRLCLFGHEGTGKSTTLRQLVHLAQHSNYFIVYVPQYFIWSRRLYMVASAVPNEFSDGQLWDQPTAGVDFIKHLFSINSHQHEKLNELKLSKQVILTDRETIASGTPLFDIFEIGKNRAKFSCDIVGVLLRELRLNAARGNMKLLVCIDSANIMYSDSKLVDKRDQSAVPSRQLALIHHVNRTIACDWSNGMVVLAPDREIFYNYKRDAIHSFEPQDFEPTPKNLFSDEGLKEIEPFITVPVERYTRQELDNVIDFYSKYLKYINNSDAITQRGRDQIFAVTRGNPKDVYKMVSYL